MRPGDVVDARYEIERLAGTGGMGAVFRARDRASGAAAAVKVLLGGDDEGRRRFAREAAVLAELRHPGIVRYLGHGATEHGESWIAMEWLEGESLEARLARGGLTTAEALDVVRAAAEALGAAHARGVVHRDVKPSNLVLAAGASARVKLLDFGIARARGDRGVTQSGAVIGSAHYMSPEQARGTADVDARADVYALGCVLFQCLTGRAPFEGTFGPAVLLRILLEEPPRVRDGRPDVPQELDDLVARMLATSPEDRPADGRDVVRAIDRLGELETTMSAPASLPSRALTGSERKVTALVLARADARDEVTARGTIVMPTTTAELARDVARHGGALATLADGTLLVSFSGDAAVTDQAERAARCALTVHAALPDAAVAIAFGQEEIARRRVGQVIDEGVVLLDLPRGHVRVDRRLAALLEARFDVGEDALGPVLRGAREAHHGVGTLLGKAIATVGRDAEIAILEAVLRACEDEPCARAALVTAPAGVGKSRLARELVARLAARDAPPAVFIARGDALRRGSPFGMLAPMLRVAADLREGEPAALSDEKLRARVARHVPEADRARVTEFLAALASAPLASPPSAELAAARADPFLLADRMREAWEDFVRAEAGAELVVFVLEDLHWGDVPTVKFFDLLLRNLASLPIFVLALARPEVHEAFPKLWAGRPVQEIVLRELGKRASERLGRAALGDAADAGAVARIVDRAAGNAFFLEELVRAEAAGGGAALPETVLATLEVRLSALDPEARRLLRAASVFGQVFWRGGVLALLGATAPEHAARVDAWLAVVEDAEFVVRKQAARFPGEVELVFRHALVRDAAYAMLTDDDRALGHRLAGRWLEAAGEPDGRVLAMHFEQGGDAPRAAAAYRRAAAQALSGDDLEVATTLARAAVACGASGALLGEARL
ncbi:MAG TPA: protein kinase, partial [Minicystis sp.]|nr:protein kinase [Minicystis sp.]